MSNRVVTGALALAAGLFAAAMPAQARDVHDKMAVSKFCSHCHSSYRSATGTNGASAWSGAKLVAPGLWRMDRSDAAQARGGYPGLSIAYTSGD